MAPYPCLAYFLFWFFFFNSILSHEKSKLIDLHLKINKQKKFENHIKKKNSCTAYKHEEGSFAELKTCAFGVILNGNGIHDRVFNYLWLNLNPNPKLLYKISELLLVLLMLELDLLLLVLLRRWSCNCYDVESERV
jgi:hypothetical protein